MKKLIALALALALSLAFASHCKASSRDGTITVGSHQSCMSTTVALDIIQAATISPHQAAAAVSTQPAIVTNSGALAPAKALVQQFKIFPAQTTAAMTRSGVMPLSSEKTYLASSKASEMVNTNLRPAITTSPQATTNSLNIFRAFAMNGSRVDPSHIDLTANRARDSSAHPTTFNQSAVQAFAIG